MLQTAWFLCFVAITAAYNEGLKLELFEAKLKHLQNAYERQQDSIQQLERMNHELRQENAQFKLQFESILDQQQKCICTLRQTHKDQSNRINTPFNVTIEELEIRVERLEEDMFQAQVDINEVEGSVNDVEINVDELQFSLQETIETVMDHSENLDQLEQEITNLESNFDDFENRTSDIEGNIGDLESDILDLDSRTSNLELIQIETRDSAFFATLSSNVAFEESYQLIVFDNAKINKGGHYDNTTGRYTAPVSGIYQIFPYIRSTPKANFRIRIDGTRYVNSIEDYDSEGSEGEAEGASVVMKLQAGQVVDVVTGSVPYNVAGDASGVFTWFGGYLLFPDPE